MMTTKLLNGQVAVVTGAGRGIGRAAALTLAEAGAAVVVVARSGDEITAVADEIKHAGGQTLAIPTDVSDPAQVDHLLVLSLRGFGRIDILVNNAALVQPVGKVWETSPAAWQQLIQVNVVGPYLCSRAVLPHMLDRGSGRIINISSGVAEKNIKGLSAYSVSKAALERFSGVLAIEMASSEVVVAVLRPGVVDTPMQADLRKTPGHLFPRVSAWQDLHLEGQLRPPEEPAQAILWLASHFGRDSNGQILRLDDDQFRQQIATDLGRPPLAARTRN
jgi:NAD(P)-dependent dehydrogenase (short-subunit alcohol dehydrogenase family)